MQRHQYIHHYPELTNSELLELEAEYHELRYCSRINRLGVDVDAESTLSDALHWMEHAVDDRSPHDQAYTDYLDDGGTEPADSYMLDFVNLRPTISNMRRPAYREWYRTHIYNRWSSGRMLGSGFTTDLVDLGDLISLWITYRQQSSSNSISQPQSSCDTSFDLTPEEPTRFASPHLIASLTPPSSPSFNSHDSNNRFSPLADDNSNMNPDPDPDPEPDPGPESPHVKASS